MTVRPHGNDFILACDGCGYTRPIATLSAIGWACDRIGWRRLFGPLSGSRLRPVVGHHCPRCAASERRAIA